MFAYPSGKGMIGDCIVRIHLLERCIAGAKAPIPGANASLNARARRKYD
jgi:hypothetical protein